MLWEVELKFAVDNPEEIRTKLLELGARFSPPIHQTDRYFNHSARDFSQTDEALRIRQVGDQNWITYKGPKVDPDSKTRRELELPLSNGIQAANQFAELLQALGFRYVTDVKKTRRSAKLTWQNHEVEASLDDVHGLGPFLELEISFDESAIESAKSALQSLSQALGLAKSERRSYLELLLRGAS